MMVRKRKADLPKSDLTELNEIAAKLLIDMASGSPNSQTLSAPTPPKRRRKITRAPKYFQGENTTAPTQSNLKKLFDSYREPDKIGIEGTQKYLEDLKIQLDEVTHFALAELVACPSIGEIDREGFVKGWQTAATPANLCDTTAKQAQYINSVIRPRLASADFTYTKQIYRYAFKLAKTDSSSRSVPMDSAVEFWKLFFSAMDGKGGIEWNTKTMPWLDMWVDFYEAEVKRPVNKDLWNMVGELVMKTRQPGGETLEWWTEDGAWPVAVDSFVTKIRSQRGGAGTMDTT